MSQSLLKLQIGPVQDFIAQARSTRDLWSGSYLLSWMAGCLVDALEQRLAERSLPKATIVSPDLKDGRNAMLNWIMNPATRAVPPAGTRTSAKDATLPTIPNQVLAQVPDGFNADDAKAVIDKVFRYGNPDEPQISHWRSICDACWQFLVDEERNIPAENCKARLSARSLLWHKQLASFWQPTWLLWPGEPLTAEEQRKRFLAIPAGLRWNRESGGTPPEEWLVQYSLVSHRLEARRQTRNFDAWLGQPGLEKDSLSGKEEAIIDRSWLAQIPRGRAGKRKALNHLFRHSDPLGAVNVVKRVWHKAYLEKAPELGGMGLNKQRLEGESARGSYFDMPSVPGIAAFPWAQQVWRRHHGNVFGDPAFERFWTAVGDIDEYLPLDLPKRREFQGETRFEWLARVDWEIFREDFWRDQEALSRAAKDEGWGKAASAGLAAVRHFIRDEKLGSPAAYYAVLAGDGDRVGRWLLGQDSQGLLFPLKQDFHQRISAMLAGFASDNTSRIIEDPAKMGSDQEHHFQGKLIYAGGEDLLAVLPANQAIGCALALRNAYISLMPHRGDARFTYSVGIAIGHIKEPLQDMAEAARAAKDRAKDLGRNALGVTLFKRSGETIEWGCPFSHGQNDPSAALNLLKFIQSGDRYRSKLDNPAYQPPISGKFPHRLAELLAPYQTFEGGDPSKPEPMTADLRDIAHCELQWAVRQQCDKLPEKERKQLVEHSAACLEELRDRGAPLSDFYNLFAIEAFIARQGD